MITKEGGSATAKVRSAASYVREQSQREPTWWEKWQARHKEEEPAPPPPPRPSWWDRFVTGKAVGVMTDTDRYIRAMTPGTPENIALKLQTTERTPYQTEADVAAKILGVVGQQAYARPQQVYTRPPSVAAAPTGSFIAGGGRYVRGPKENYVVDLAAGNGPNTFIAGGGRYVRGPYMEAIDLTKPLPPYLQGFLSPTPIPSPVFGSIYGGSGGWGGGWGWGGNSGYYNAPPWWSAMDLANWLIW